MKTNSQGTTLCAHHAREVAENMSVPTSECWPSSTWTGGDGQTVTCDMLIDPDRVQRYIDYVSTPRGRWAPDRKERT